MTTIQDEIDEMMHEERRCADCNNNETRCCERCYGYKHYTNLREVPYGDEDDFEEN